MQFKNEKSARVTILVKGWDKTSTCVILGTTHDEVLSVLNAGFNSQVDEIPEWKTRERKPRVPKTPKEAKPKKAAR